MWRTERKGEVVVEEEDIVMGCVGAWLRLWLWKEWKLLVSGGYFRYDVVVDFVMGFVLLGGMLRRSLGTIILSDNRLFLYRMIGSSSAVRGRRIGERVWVK